MIRAISAVALGAVLTFGIVSLGGSVMLDTSGTGPPMPADCSGVKLTAASASVGPKFAYRFQGSCKNKVTGKVVQVEVNAVYNAGQYKALENVKLTGTGGGEMNSVLRCTSDPFINGNAPCTLKAHSNNTRFPITKSSLPVAKGLTTEAQAKAMRAKSAPLQAPPPPPPPKK